MERINLLFIWMALSVRAILLIITKYGHAFVALLTFLWGITVFTNAAAVLDGSLSSKAFTLRGVTAPPKVGATGGAGKGGKGGDAPGGPVAPGGSGSAAGDGSRVVGGTLVRPSTELRTIEQEGLVRSVENKEVNTPGWMEGYAGDVKNGWKVFHIKQGARRGAVVADYLVHPENQAYITQFVKTENINMKYRDIVVDNYKSATNGHTNPKVIGTEDIQQPAARASLEAAIRAQGKDVNNIDGAPLEFTPTSRGWTEIMTNNAFTEGQMKMLPSLSDGGKTVSIQKFTIVAEGKDSPDLHLITTIVYT
ncbi:uncharacterized protein BP5553_02681 [Venustampulla echinocandica]|uniref:Uncharacterized protein n=1 Tax=Venustampulla echinocandica TaxID=2656787 RepID=A0A370TS43_9HELO|nr:uncharacterized protein BP5553_02681 [Venustampulla echinocandica]RDL38341.1 hypothetical protein BP5553_02681 [Venustampulla echinocandica]